MKYCVCGAANPSDAKKCSYCGRDLTNVKADDTDYLEEQQTGSGKKKDRQGRTVIIKDRTGGGRSEVLAMIGGMIIVLLGIIIYLLISGNNPLRSSEQQNVAQQQNEVQQQNVAGQQNTVSQSSSGLAAAESGTTSQASSAATNPFYSSQELELPYVNPSASGFYADNLDPAQYYTWKYDNTFYFSYPAQLYQRVEGDNTLFDVLDGNNEIRYDFYSNEEGAHLCYQKINIKKGISHGQAASEWFDSECGSLYDIEVILKKIDGDEKSRCIFTGFVDSAKTVSVYEVITAMNGNLYRMRVEMPVPVNSTDRSQKFYITECLYRECGFSGSTSNGCRSYQEYLEAE